MANRYAVAIASLFENKNEIQYIGADSELHAMRCLLKQEIRGPFSKLNKEPIDSVEDIIDIFFNSDVLVSRPVIV